MLKLRLWITKNNLSHATLAEALDIHPKYISNFLRGSCRISKKLARKIERHTLGEVKASDVREDMPKTPRPKKEKIKQMDIKDFNQKLQSIVKVAQPGELPDGWGKL